MRGALERKLGSDDYIGIIPADAGSTTPEKLHLDGKQDHPRRCGEHLEDHESGVAGRGSSPQMRGAPWYRIARLLRLGIIPADAWSTLFTEYARSGG